MLAAVDSRLAVTHLEVPPSVVPLGPLTKLRAAYLIDRRKKTSEKASSCLLITIYHQRFLLPSLNTAFCFKHKEYEDLHVKAPNLRSKTEQRAADQKSKVWGA